MIGNSGQEKKGWIRPNILMSGIAVVVQMFFLLWPAHSALAGTPGLWTTTGSMSTPRYYKFSATLLPTGKVLVAGGGSTAGGFTASAELYDPSTRTWSTTGSMTVSRNDHTATLLPNGKVLVVGGYNNSGGVAYGELYDPSTGIWTPTGSMTSPRVVHAATLLSNGKVLVTGGYYNASIFLNTADLYDPNTGTFTATGPMTTSRIYHTSVLLSDGRVLVMGGCTSNCSSPFSSAELYDPATGIFTATGSMGTARQGAENWAVRLSNGKVLVAGGGTPGSISVASTELYDPTTGTFSPTGSMTTPRSWGDLTLLPNGKALISGGENSNGSTATILASAELYDPTTGTWTPTGSMSTPRYTHRATLLPNGQVLVAGGSDNLGNILASTELYCPDLGVVPGMWTTTGSMGTVRDAHTSTLLPNGKVLIAGGENSSSISLNSAELYDPATGTFSPTGSMTSARSYHTAILLPNGKVLIIGGINGTNFLNTAELYDPATGLFSATGSMGTAGHHRQPSLLPSGKILVSGGIGPSGYISSAEIYDPATGFFSSTGSMIVPRGAHTATLLPNGKVLVAGGVNSITGYLSSAELYDPTTGLFSSTGSMGTNRGDHTATLLPNGEVLIAGGYNSVAGLLASAELYDPSTGLFTATGSLGTARWALTATLLPNGKVLVAGGTNTTGAPSFASAELYDLATGLFSSTGSMSAPRQFQTATLLPNGKVLTAGGWNGGSLASAELYTTTCCGPQINTISPTFGTVGTAVTINGFNFGTTQGTSAVTFNTVNATTSSWSDTRIIATVPSGATTGPVVVTVNGVASNGLIFTGVPDLVVSSISASLSGNFLTNTDTVANQGNGFAGAFAVGYYLSTGTTFSSLTDIFIGSRSVAGLGAGATNSASTVLTIPSSVPSGTYHVTAFADYTNAIAESNKNNNTLTTSGTQFIGPMITTPAQLPNATVGAPYNFTLSATGGVAPYTYGLVSGSLPPGVSFSTTGVFSGTPTTTGNFSFNLNVTDSTPRQGLSSTFTLKVLPALSSITVTPANPTINVGQTQLFTATGTFSDSSTRVLNNAIVSARGNHTCALLSDGTVQCWGQNIYGELGNGTNTSSTTPVPVSGLSGLVTAISAGTVYTCALLFDGTVQCWGDNTYGELGNGTNTSSTTPVPVSGLLGPVIAISAGQYHTCALLSGGTVKCWGYNTYGELGNGTNTSSTTPVPVSGLSSLVTAISAGAYQTCALLSGGTVQCWGQNSYGELGNGTNTSSTTPVPVSGISAGTAISAGGYQTCALLSGGTVQCWGWNAYGQLGNGTTTNSSTPVTVSGISTATAINGGFLHTCALLSGGTVKCWGDNTYGELGNGTNTSSTTPVPVSGISTATAISLSLHTCAVLAGGTVQCWGINADGELGNGTTTNSSTPVTVSGILSALSIVWSSSNTAVATINANGVAGGLSAGTTTIMATSGSISGTTTLTVGVPDLVVSSLSVSQSGSSLTINDTAANQGNGVAGAFSVGYYLSTGTTFSSLTDIFIGSRSVAGLAAGATSSASTTLSIPSTVPAGSYHVTAFADYTNAIAESNKSNNTLTSSNTVIAPAAYTLAVSLTGAGSGSITSSPAGINCGTNCSANFTAGSTVTLTATPGPGSAFGGFTGGCISNTTSCTVTLTGNTRVTAAFVALTSITVTPANPIISLGQTQQFTATGSITPAAISMAAGWIHTCALFNGTIQCWGKNDAGQLGNGAALGSTTPVTTPVNVTGITNASAIAIGVGGTHTCALTNGTVQCWGYNANGQLGNGSTSNNSTPQTVKGITNAVAVGAGWNHSCAVLADGTIQCWGYNSSGELGPNAILGSNYLTPIQVSGITNARLIVGGGGGGAKGFACALLTGGTVKCWGANGSGQLGNGSNLDNATPQTVSGITNAAAISAGFTHACALLSDGTVKCWGANGSGQLGNSSTVASNTPVTAGISGSATSISSGGAHTCALLSTGALQCWGDNTYGQIGLGGAGSAVQTPATVASLTGTLLSNVTLGSVYTCVTLTNGGMKCWGINDVGQLGNGTTSSPTLSPTAVSGVNPVVTTAFTLNWSSSNTAVATINTNGLATGLSPGTSTIMATSGSISGSTTLTVFGPPTATTGTATNMTSSGATLNGNVNPNGATTIVWFEYGTTASYGSSTAAQTIPAGTTAVAVSASLAGLSSNTTYHFRIDASNNGGTRYGADNTFTTLNSLTILFAGTGGGSVSNSGLGIACGTNCNYSFPNGTIVTLTAAPSTGSSFAGFSGGCVNSSTNCTFQMTGDLTVTMTFNLTSTPAITSISPTALLQFATTPAPGITITGSNFQPGAIANFGPGAQVNSTTFINSTTLVASVSALPPNPVPSVPGTYSTYNMTVTNPDGGTATTTNSPLTIVADSDGDGVPDNYNGVQDNCPFAYNPDQTDICHTMPGVSASGASPATILPPPSSAGYYSNMPIYFPISVTFSTTTSAQPTYYALPPNPNNVIFTVTDSTGKTVPPTRIPEFSPINIPGSLVYINATQTYTAYVDLTQWYPNLQAGSYTVTLTYVSLVRDPDLSPTGTSCGNPAGCYPIWMGTATTSATSVSIQSAASSPPSPPAATTGSAGSISSSGAALNGTVNPNNSATTVWFEYGLSTTYGLNTATQSITAGTAAVNVSAMISGLSANTLYHFRLDADNSGGTSYGTDATLTTLANPPVMTTGTATNISSSGATLNGTVNPNGVPATVWFEYGTTASYGSSTAAQTISAGTTAVPVSATLAGLSSNTTYHFRIDASNNGGTSYGADNTFTTLNSLTILFAGTGGGFVSNSGLGIACETSCNYSFPNGTIVTLTAAPSTGSSFAGFSGGCVNSSTICTFQMTGDLTVTLTFNLTSTPAITSISSSTTLLQFATTPAPGITITGSNFQPGATANFGPGAQVNSTTFINATTLVASVSALPPNPVPSVPGTYSTYNVTVTNPDGGTASTTNSPFTIVADSDGDGVPDNYNGVLDNCPFAYNPDQTDICHTMPGVSASGASPATILPPPSSAGYYSNMPIYFPILVTFSTTTSAQPTYYALPPNPNNVIFTVKDSAGNTVQPARIPEFSPINIPGSLVYINATQTYTAYVDLTQWYPNLQAGSYTVTLTYVSLVRDPDLSPTGTSCGNPAGCYPIWMGTATTSATSVSIQSAASSPPSPPAVTTGSAGSISSSGAALNGTVNPNNSATSVWFEYGLGTTYGLNTATQSISAGTTAVAVSVAITGLSGNTTYHFRLDAVNSGGTSYGTDATFTTLPSKLVFTSAAQTVTAGTVSGAVTIQLLDSSGTLATGSNAKVNLTSSSGTMLFSASNAFTSTVTSITLNAGTGTFYFKDTTAGTPAITMASVVSTSAIQTETINPAPASKLVIISAAQNVIAGNVSSPVTVQARDQYGNLVTSSNATVNLSSVSSFGSGIAWSGTLSKFVTVGLSGKIMTSSDGIIWTQQTSGTTYPLFGVTWSGTLSKFVAVGASGTIVSSSDGVTWTARTSGTTNTLAGVSWSATLSRFTAAGELGTIVTSLDGVTWTARTSGTTNALLGVASSGSQFAVVGASGSIVTSSDGVTWTARVSGTTNALAGVAWSGSQFVVVGASGTIVTSSDGVTWTLSASGTTNALVGVAWSGNLFVAVGGNETILTSPNGISWTTRMTVVSNALINNPLFGVTWSGNQFVAVGAFGTILTSMDGVNWTSRTSVTMQFSGSITFSSLVTSITLSGGQGAFYFEDRSAGTPTITAASTGLTSALQTETITSAPLASLAFANGPFSIQAGSVAGPVYIVARDKYGNPVGNLTVNLSASDTTMQFSLYSSFSSATTSITTSSTGLGSFYFKDSTTGNVTITLTSGSVTASQTEKITK